MPSTKSAAVWFRSFAKRWNSSAESTGNWSSRRSWSEARVLGDLPVPWKRQLSWLSRWWPFSRKFKLGPSTIRRALWRPCGITLWKKETLSVWNATQKHYPSWLQIPPSANEWSTIDSCRKSSKMRRIWNESPNTCSLRKDSHKWWPKPKTHSSVSVVRHVASIVAAVSSQCLGIRSRWGLFSQKVSTVSTCGLSLKRRVEPRLMRCFSQQRAKKLTIRVATCSTKAWTRSFCATQTPCFTSTWSIIRTRTTSASSSKRTSMW